MRSCTGLYLHGDVILQQKLEKTRRVYLVQGDICQAFHNYAAMSYICWQDKNVGQPCPKPLDKLMFWLQNQLITLKGTFISKQFLSETAYVLNWMLTKSPFVLRRCSANERKNQRCLMDLTTWLYLCCEHVRSDAQIQLFSKWCCMIMWFTSCYTHSSSVVESHIVFLKKNAMTCHWDIKTWKINLLTLFTYRMLLVINK